MAESVPSSAWIDETINSVTIGTSKLGPELEEKERASTLTTDSSPVDNASRFVGHSFSKQLGKLASNGSDSLTKRVISIPRPTQRFDMPNTLRVSRVRTDAARRMEIAQLKLEVLKLEARVDYLMQKAIRRAGLLPTLAKSRLVNDKLRRIAHHQRLWIARGMSAISQSLPQCSRSLLDYSIRLPCDASSRVKTLCDLRVDILRDGREILHERMRFLTSDLLHRSEVSSFSTAGGDIYGSVFATIPVEGTASVKDVLGVLRKVDTLDQVFTCQKTGSCCTTESVDTDPGLDQNGIAYRRCVRLTASGRVVESKVVLFSEYQASSVDIRHVVAGRDCSEQATIVTHSVEDDQLYPYVDDRIRLDITAIISIHHHRSHCQRYQLGSGFSRDTKDGIVITWTSFAKFRRCGVSISTSELRAEMEYMLSKGPEALEAALEHVTTRQDSSHRISRSTFVDELPHQFTPLQDIDVWPSGDWELSTA